MPGYTVFLKHPVNPVCVLMVRQTYTLGLSIHHQSARHTMIQLSKIDRIRATNDTAEATQMREKWTIAVRTLARQVSEWAVHQKKWTIIPQPDKEIAEEPIEGYIVPVVRIQTNKGTAVLEPIAQNVGGSDGRVDLYAYPSMFRVKLLYRESDQKWTVRTDSGLDWPHPWSEATFVELVNGLVGV